MKQALLLVLVLGTSACDEAFQVPADAGTDATVLPDASPDDLAGMLDPIRVQQGLPALAGAVWRGSDLIAIGVSGVRKLGDSTAAATADQWHLGSDTKAMTATLVGIYVDRGKLHFEDTIGTLFAGETIDPGYANVTLLQLLEHRGGTPGDLPDDVWTQMWNDGSSPDARITAVRALLSRAPAQAPGTFVYSNAGYMIAGAALERAAGATWEQIMQQELFNPLGMASCAFGAPGHDSPIDEPWGHETLPDGGEPIPLSPADPSSDNPPSLGPAGTVHCSLADWGRFFTMHLAGARGEPTALLTQATVTRLQTVPTGGDYACGWIVTQRSWAGGITLTHSGSNTLWFATVWLAPAKNLAFAVVTNRGDDVAANAVDSAFGPLIDRYAN